MEGGEEGLFPPHPYGGGGEGREGGGEGEGLFPPHSYGGGGEGREGEGRGREGERGGRGEGEGREGEGGGRGGGGRGEGGEGRGYSIPTSSRIHACYFHTAVNSPTHTHHLPFQHQVLT